MTAVAPASVTGAKTSDSTFPTGKQGAGMKLDLTVSPTTVSFQALEFA